MGHEAEGSTGARLLGAGDVRALADRLGLRPMKQLGQNFVTDSNTIRRIVRAAGVTPADTVLEIGPGLGSLTLGLLDVARHVVAVEVDPRLAEALPETVARHAPGRADRLTVVQADALHLTARQVRDALRRAAPAETQAPGTVQAPAETQESEPRSGPSAGHDSSAEREASASAGPSETEGEPALPRVLVANLPYNVAVPVLLHTLREFPDLDRGLVMVQLEVAERLAAPPGGKAYGVPSVKMAWYAETRQAGLVGRGVFWPQPRVDSGLVAFTRRRPPRTSASREQVFAVVEAAFAQRRKTLRAALAGAFGSPQDAEEALRAAGVDPGARGERLGIAEFARIAEHLPPSDPRRTPDGSRGATHTPGAPS